MFNLDDFNDPQPDEGEQALADLLNKVMFDWSDILTRVRELALGEKNRLIADGWDEQNAELMAMSVYGTLLTRLAGVK